MSTDRLLVQVNRWLGRFRAEFHSESPGRIHNRDIADDGSPQWSPEFAKWISAREVIDTPYPAVPTEEHRLRTTRALRKLRKVNVRGFELAYRQLAAGEPLEKSQAWLNERALRNRIPLPKGRTEHYTERDVLVMLFAALHHMNWYY